MKFLGLFLFVLSPLFAQNEIVTNPQIGMVYTVIFNMETLNGYQFYDKLIFEITAGPNGEKIFTFQLRSCANWADTSYEGGSTPAEAKLVVKFNGGCGQLNSASDAISVGVVQAQIGEFLSDDSDAPHRIVYGKPGFRAHLTSTQPAIPPGPYATMLDGLGNTLDKFDLTTFAMVSQVAVPSTAGPYGVRPTSTGPENEIWVANTTSGISIADLGGQTVVASIATPSVPPTATPVGIAFTNDGATAFEAFQYDATDSSGNNGALLIYDAVNRVLKSTFPLKYYPSALVMAPDGLTLYLLSTDAMLTYYDVLSGTADLSVSTYPSGTFGGYPGYGTPAFIHPDGTRLFWNINNILEVFDLTTRQVTNFNTSLSTSAGVVMQLSQDGAQAFMSSGDASVVVLDTRNGNVVANYQSNEPSRVFGGAPAAP